jgi:hypothetical protein
MMRPSTLRRSLESALEPERRQGVRFQPSLTRFPLRYGPSADRPRRSPTTQWAAGRLVLASGREDSGGHRRGRRPCSAGSDECSPGFSARVVGLLSTISMTSTRPAGIGPCMSLGRMGICPSDGWEKSPSVALRGFVLCMGSCRRVLAVPWPPRARSDLGPHPYQAYSRDAFKLVERTWPAGGRGDSDRGCPLGTALDRPMWHASGTAGEDDPGSNVVDAPCHQPFRPRQPFRTVEDGENSLIDPCV